MTKYNKKLFSKEINELFEEMDDKTVKLFSSVKDGKPIFSEEVIKAFHESGYEVAFYYDEAKHLKRIANILNVNPHIIGEFEMFLFAINEDESYEVENEKRDDAMKYCFSFLSEQTYLKGQVEKILDLAIKTFKYNKDINQEVVTKKQLEKIISIKLLQEA